MEVGAGVPVELSVAAPSGDEATLAHTGYYDPASAVYSKSTACSKSPAMGPPIRSASARNASASIRTTFSAVFFI